MQLCGARRKYLRAVHLGDASARLAPFDRWRDLLVGEPHRLDGSLHHRLTIGDGASKVELGSAADALVSRARLRDFFTASIPITVTAMSPTELLLSVAATPFR